MLPSVRFVPQFHFEAPEDGGGAATATVDAPAVQPEPTQTEAGESWSISRDEWEETQAALSEIAQYLRGIDQTEPQAQQAEEFQLPTVDPYADDFAEQLAARDAALVQQITAQMQQALAPLYQAQQGAALSEAEERALDILEDAFSREGDVAEKETAIEMARAVANVYFQEEAERFGFGPKAAERALERAATAIQARDKAVAEAAVERYKNQLAGLAGAPTEPSAGSVGTQTITSPAQYASETDLVRKYAGLAR